MTEAIAIKVARMEAQMSNLEEKVDKLDVKMDAVITKLDTAAAMSNELLVIKSNMLGFETRIKHMQSRTWVQNTLSAILGVILTSLTIFFLTNVGNS